MPTTKRDLCVCGHFPSAHGIPRRTIEETRAAGGGCRVLGCSCPKTLYARVLREARYEDRYCEQLALARREHAEG